MSENNEHNGRKLALATLSLATHIFSLVNYYGDLSIYTSQCITVDNPTVISDTYQEYKLKPDLSESPDISETWMKVLNEAQETDFCSVPPPPLSEYVKDDLIGFIDDERRQRQENSIKDEIANGADFSDDVMEDIPPDMSVLEGEGTASLEKQSIDKNDAITVEKGNEKGIA